MIFQTCLTISWENIFAPLITVKMTVTAKNGEISPWFFVGNFGETDTSLTVS